MSRPNYMRQHERDLARHANLGVVKLVDRSMGWVGVLVYGPFAGNQVEEYVVIRGSTALSRHATYRLSPCTTYGRAVAL